MKLSQKTVILGIGAGAVVASMVGIMPNLIASATTEAPAAPAATSTVVSIPATTAWTDTGVALTAGQSFSVSATGVASYHVQTGASSGPAGIPFTNKKCAVNQLNPAITPTFTAPGLRCYSLIGRIGSGPTIFYVGSSFTVTTPAAGELYLGYDDNYYPDNGGSFTATISH